ncbi:MAG TPA: hypothetical protein PLD75_09075, partial [Spirochaetota bacterium]|nr:hypothetical protein [Spirochaetota bacterium]
KDLKKDKKDLKKEKEKITKEEENIQKEKEKIESKKEEITKKEEQLQKEKENLKNIEDQKEKEKKEKELAKKEEEVQKEKEKLSKEDENLKKKEEQITEKKEDIIKKEEDTKKKEEQIAKKEEEVKKDKKDIEKDEINKKIETNPDEAKKQLQKKEEQLTKKEEELEKRESELKKQQTDKNIFAGKLYYLKIKDYMEGGHYNNEMYIINAYNMNVEVKSDVTTICGNKYDVNSEGVIVIAHKGSHSQDHNLLILDKDTLKEKIRGKENIFWRSFVIFREDYIYAIIKQDTSYYLGKFDSKLNLVNKSEELVDSNTFISFFDKYIYINDPKKNIIVLDKDSLKLIQRINP